MPDHSSCQFKAPHQRGVYRCCKRSTDNTAYGAASMQNCFVQNCFGRGVRRFSTNYPLPDARLCEKIFSPGLSCVKSLSLAVFRTRGAALQTLSGRFSFCSRAADP
jgi:hypothetical protein